MTGRSAVFEPTHLYKTNSSRGNFRESASACARQDLNAVEIIVTGSPFNLRRVGLRPIPFKRYAGAGIGESVVIVTMIAVFPATVATTIIPPSFVAVIRFIVVAIAIAVLSR